MSLGALAPTTYDVPALWERHRVLAPNWARVYATWARVEPDAGQYDWNYLDNRMTRMEAIGVREFVITIDQERPAHVDRERFAERYAVMALALAQWLGARRERVWLEALNETWYTGNQLAYLPAAVTTEPALVAFLLDLHARLHAGARACGLRIIGRNFAQVWTPTADAALLAGGLAGMVDAIGWHDYSMGYDRADSDPRLPYRGGPVPNHRDRLAVVARYGLPIISTEFGSRGDSTGLHPEWLAHWWLEFAAAGGIMVAPQSVIDNGGEVGLGGFESPPIGVSWEQHHVLLPKTLLLRELVQYGKPAAAEPAPAPSPTCRAVDHTAQLDRIEAKLVAPSIHKPSIARINACSRVTDQGAAEVGAYLRSIGIETIP